MAKLQSAIGFNFQDVNFNRILSGFIESEVDKNFNFDFDGRFYKQKYEVHYQYNGNVFSSTFLGDNLIIDEKGFLVSGNVGGYFEAFWGNNTWNGSWGATEINLDAKQIYDAITTPTHYDDWIVFKQATSGNDIIFGSNNSDYLYGYDGNDIIFGRGEYDYINGGDGFDTAVYSHNISNYWINKYDNGSFAVGYTEGGEGIDTLQEVEQLKFSDITLVLSHNTPIAETVYLLYRAAFARMPDNQGFLYWAEKAETDGLNSLEIAKEFTVSQEFLQKFGSNPSHNEYVTTLYENVLGREPDKEGLEFWVHRAENGRTHEQLLVDFAASLENIQLAGVHVTNGFWTV